MSLAKKIFSIFQRDLLLFVTNLVTGIIVARTLGPTALGIWVILSIVPSYAEAFGRTKADLAAVYFLGQKTFRREDILFNLNLIALVASGLILGLIFWQFEPIYNWLFRSQMDNYKPELLVLMIQIPINSLYLNYSYFHIAEENVKVYNRMVVINSLANSFMVIGLLILTSIELWSVILGALIGISLGLLYGWLSIDRKDWVAGLPSKKISFALLRYGIHFYLGGVLGQLQKTGTNLLAVAFLLPAQLAFLSQAQGVGRLLDNMVNPINTLLFPRISNSEQDAAIEVSCTAFRISSILMVFGGLALAIIAELLIVLLYGPAFQPSASLIRYLLPGIVITGACGTLGSYFNGIGRANIIPKIKVLPVILQLVLTWYFLQWWGLAGAATAISIGMSLYGVILLLVFKSVTGVSYNLLIPSLADVLYLKGFVVELISQTLKLKTSVK